MQFTIQHLPESIFIFPHFITLSFIFSNTHTCTHAVSVSQSPADYRLQKLKSGTNTALTIAVSTFSIQIILFLSYCSMMQFNHEPYFVAVNRCFFVHQQPSISTFKQLLI